jgi:hypothetical protein
VEVAITDSPTTTAQTGRSDDLGFDLSFNDMLNFWLHHMDAALRPYPECDNHFYRNGEALSFDSKSRNAFFTVSNGIPCIQILFMQVSEKHREQWT